MNVTDPVADMLTRIRNAQQAQHEVVAIPASKMKIGIAHILKEEGFIKAYKCIRDRRQGTLKIALRYTADGDPVIRFLERVSRPSLRRYVGADEIPKVKNGFGTTILSTSKGLMTGKKALKAGVGGEVLCRLF